MSTRCNIHFNYSDGTVAANIYRHCDGYPDGVLPDLARFFQDVQDQTDDTRFNDPPYLAAKFVVWQAAKNAESQAFDYRTGKIDPSKIRPLNFISLGVVSQDAGDGEYVYEVTATTNGGLPVVTSKEAE